MKKITILFAFIFLLCFLGIFAFGISIINAQDLTPEQLKTLKLIRPEAVEEVTQWILKFNQAEQALESWKNNELAQAKDFVRDAQNLAAVFAQAPEDSEQKRASREALEATQEALRDAELTRGALNNFKEATGSALFILAKYSSFGGGLYGLNPESLEESPGSLRALQDQTNQIRNAQYKVTEAQIEVGNARFAADEARKRARDIYGIANTAGNYQMTGPLRDEVSQNTKVVEEAAREVRGAASDNRIGEAQAGGRVLPGVEEALGLGAEASPPKEAQTPAQYVRNLFIFGLSAVGILALVAMVVGGIVYLTSAGNPGRISKAKSIIGGALAGLALLLCSYIILRLINPDLVRLRMPELAPASQPSQPYQISPGTPGLPGGI